MRKKTAAADAPLPRRVRGPSRAAPWLEELSREIASRPDDTQVFVLVDQAGAAALMAGIVPQYVKDQAASALSWTLETATKPAGW